MSSLYRPIACSALFVLQCAVLISLAQSQVVINAPPTVIDDVLFDLRSGTTLNVGPGGMVGVIEPGILNGLIRARSGSIANIFGGTVGNFDAFAGSEVNISGGVIASGFDAESGSDVNISGGALGTFFEAHPGSDVEVIGGEFRLNGTEFVRDTFTLDEANIHEVFTGTLADGSAFAFSPVTFDHLEGVTLTRAPLPSLDLTPMIVDAPVTTGPSGLRSGQTLTLREGGVLRDNFTVVDATLNIEGGILGLGGEVAGGTVNVSGGRVGQLFNALAGSQVNISGGAIGDRFDALPGSEINLFGTQFLLDGVPISGLQIGKAFTINDREVTLSGLLVDRSPFSFDLNTSPFAQTNFFPLNATLTITLVPEPTAIALTALACCGLCAPRMRSSRSR